MQYTRYKKTRFIRHIWFALAIFFVIFNSTPVKRFIRIYLFSPSVYVELAGGEQLTSSCVKDCTLLERHTGSVELHSDMMQQHSNDADSIFFLSSVLLFAPFLLAQNSRRPLAYHTQYIGVSGNVPLYLHNRRLQV